MRDIFNSVQQSSIHLGFLSHIYLRFFMIYSKFVIGYLPTIKNTNHSIHASRSSMLHVDVLEVAGKDNTSFPWRRVDIHERSYNRNLWHLPQDFISTLNSTMNWYSSKCSEKITGNMHNLRPFGYDYSIHSLPNFFVDSYISYLDTKLSSDILSTKHWWYSCQLN